MRSIRSVALPLVRLLLVQIAPVALAQGDATLFELRGKVVNALTGEPVSGALLGLPGQPARFSDSDGSFAFAGLPRGRVVVSVHKPGFFGEQELGRCASSYRQCQKTAGPSPSSRTSIQARIPWTHILVGYPAVNECLRMKPKRDVLGIETVSNRDAR